MLWKGFQKPKRLVANTETLTDKYGQFPRNPLSVVSVRPSATPCAACCCPRLRARLSPRCSIEGVMHEFHPFPE